MKQKNLSERERNLIAKFIKSKHLFHEYGSLNETYTPFDIIRSLRPFEEMSEKTKKSLFHKDDVSIKKWSIKLFELIAPKIERREELS